MLRISELPASECVLSAHKKSKIGVETFFDVGVLFCLYPFLKEHTTNLYHLFLILYDKKNAPKKAVLNPKTGLLQTSSEDQANLS